VRHYHARSRQFFFVLRGTLTVEVAGAAAHTLREHHGVEVPPGMTHEVRNDSEEPAEFLVISQPPSHGDRVLVE
jgi:mannose-6-phosphate isomerase-like protein (cupin superfamily)